MAGQGKFNALECCIVGPPPKALPKRSEKDMALDDLLKVDSRPVSVYSRMILVSFASLTTSWFISSLSKRHFRPQFV